MRIPCDGVTIGLDSSDADVPFLSHAHSDHTSGVKGAKAVLASGATLDLARMDGVEVIPHGARLLDAGHILGARMLAVESDGERTVYTGDFCTRPNIFGMKAEAPQCDRLIMEATYGDPAYVFPPHEEVHGMVRRWVAGNDSANLVIGCYELGKAQEMVRILNECGVAPVVTEKTDSFCRVYEKHGLRLERVVVGSDAAEDVMSRRFVALVPMGKARKYFASRLAQAFERKTLCAVATGWALHYRFNTDAAFPLSDHADFRDLADFVSQSGAKKVEFFTGDGSAVVDAVRAKNGDIINS
jgi:putative mRNA 3-end processing factor